MLNLDEKTVNPAIPAPDKQNNSDIQPFSFEAPLNACRNEKQIDWLPASFIVAMHLGSLAAFFTFSWPAFFVCIFLHFVTGCVGITLTYHRLLTHRSFRVPRWFEYFLAIIGCLACQSGPITWVTAHRLHHMKSDQTGDPHSPIHGFFWAHMGWCMVRNPPIEGPANQRKFAPDLANDGIMNLINKTHIIWTFLLAGFLYIVGGWPFVVYGIFVRAVLVYHSTWLVNSAAHIWGYRTYKSTDRSTNLWWVALLTYGEGWHNNHHSFQYSARHGLKWWEFDITYLMIKFLKWVRLASDIKIPSEKWLNGKYAPGVEALIQAGKIPA